MALPDSDDDRNSATVGAPRRARHVSRPLGAEERDDGGNLVRLREPAERPALRHRFEHFLLRLPAHGGLLLGETALSQPRVRSRWARRHGVAPDTVTRV